jgi:ribosome-binding factor A
MKQNAASRRFSEQARQAIAQILMFEISDPRLEMVTITGCEVSFDRSVCNVYYTAGPGDYAEVARALEAASGRIRSLAARSLGWRVAPQLRFFLDESVDTAQRIASALEAERGRMGADASAEEGDGYAGASD